MSQIPRARARRGGEAPSSELSEAIASVVSRQVRAIAIHAAEHRLHAIASLEARDQMALAVARLLDLGLTADAVAELTGLSSVSVLGLEGLGRQLVQPPRRKP